jgi:hypothetical protein
MKINQGYIPVCGCVNDRYRFSAIQTVAVCFSKVFARPVNQDRSHGCEPSDWLFRGRGSKLPPWFGEACFAIPALRSCEKIQRTAAF